MADRTIEIVIRGKNIAGETFEDVKADIGGLEDTAKHMSTAMDYAFGQVAYDALVKLSDAASRAFGAMVTAAIESEAQTAQLEAVLKSTAGAAGVTADAALELADSLSQLTLYEDDAILGAENLLLTFTSISKDIFPEATAIILDMSTALGQGLKESAIQVGKALNDPITGVTALRRVGVQFNDAQEEMIKKMVEAGDLMGAQKYILEELQTEFEGSAEAAADTFGGALSQLHKSWGEFLEDIGKAMTENEAFKNLLVTLTDVLNSLAGAFNNLPEGIQIAIIGAVGFAAVIGKLVPMLIALKLMFGTAGVAAGGAGLGGILTALSGFITGTLIPALTALAVAIGTAILTPIGLLVVAIGLLIGVIVYLGEDAKNTFMMIADIIAASLNRAIYEVTNFFRDLISQATTWARSVRDWFATIGTNIVYGIWDGIQGGWEWLKSMIQANLISLLDWVKQQLGISSPSMVFAVEVGKPMAHGIAAGFGEAMTRTAAPAMARSISSDMLMGAGTVNRYDVGRIEVHNPLTQNERQWIRRNQERSVERTLTRIIK